LSGLRVDGTHWGFAVNPEDDQLGHGRRATPVDRNTNRMNVNVCHSTRVFYKLKEVHSA